MGGKVLDSWAVMAWLNDEEPAASHFEALLDDATLGRTALAMSMVNVGEVYHLVAKRYGQRQATSFWEEFQTTPIRILPAPNALILEAARWKSQYPISYADAFALASVLVEQAVLVTGDPDFRALSEAGVVQLEWIGS